MVGRWQLRPRDFESVRARRKEFRAFLAGQTGVISGFGSHELILGELATNAVRYGAKPIWATVDDGIVRIDVEDSGDCFDLDRRLSEGPRMEGGRGHSIVQKLADSLIVHYSAEACLVTATLAL